MTTDKRGTVDLVGQNGHDPETLRTARLFAEWGLDWLAYRDRSKDANRRPGWLDEPCPSLEDAERIFRSGPHTIGVQLRRMLADCDLDAPEVVRAAMLAPERWRLPATMMWGRAGKPRSHLSFALSQPHEAVILTDAGITGEGAKLLEFRVKGQTVAPGSHHDKTGETVRWEPDGCRPPEAIDPARVVPKLVRYAAVGLVARYWVDGDRHDMSGPLAGLLYYGGMKLAEAEEFVRWVCAVADDPQVDNRLGYLRDTYDRGEHGGDVTGGPTLERDHGLTKAQVRDLRVWLGLKAKGGRGSDLLGPDLMPLTRNGDGDRFAAMWAGQVLYAAEENQWYIWDGRRWRADDVGEVRERAKQVVAEFRRCLGVNQNACGQNGVDTYRACSEHAVGMDNPTAITAMLTSAASKEEIRVRRDALDTHPNYLNVLDCTVELDTETGRVTSHQHRPEDRLTMLAPVHFYPDATHRLVDQFEARFFVEADRRTFLEEMAGASLHGYPKRDALELIGERDTGKSTALKLFHAMLGEYAMSFTSDNLKLDPRKGGDVPRPDLWRARNKRLVICTEVEPGTHLNVALFKAVTSGGDPILVRTFFDAKGGQDTVLCFALWMAGNRPYGPPPNEAAAYERLHVLDCTHQVPARQRDSADERALTTDQDALDAAFALAVRDFQRLYGEKGGVLAAPESGQQRKRELQNQLDDWTGVIDQLFEVTGCAEDGVPKSEVWEAARLEAGLGRNSYKTQQAFEASLERRGVRLTHSSARFNGRDYWEGLRTRGYRWVVEG
jgi:phage/plasmid-associated DNA primase